MKIHFKAIRVAVFIGLTIFAGIQTLLFGGPEIQYSTLAGGEAWDRAQAVAVDGQGFVYVAGWTGSSAIAPAFPEFSKSQGENLDAFVMKIDPSKTGSSALVYAAYIGGSGNDQCFDMAVTPAGEVILVGETDSVDFPLKLPVQDQLNRTSQDSGSATDGFIVKLSATGDQLVFSTYWGGGGFDSIRSLALDQGDDLLVALTAEPFDPPPVDHVLFGNQLADFAVPETHITRFSTMGAVKRNVGIAFVSGGDLAIDSQGQIYLLSTMAFGYLDDPNTPEIDGVTVLNGLQTDWVGGFDGLLYKLNSNAGNLLYSTVLGGSESDFFRDIQVG